MTPSASKWDRIKDLVGQACERPANERAAFIGAQCADDEELRTEVESLVHASESSDALLHPDADAWIGASREQVTLPTHGRFGNFEIERVLAEGPGSVVYAARQPGSARRIALKVIRALPMLGPDPRFWTEAAAASRVEHPNVVRVYEVGLIDAAPGPRLPYIAMELVEGVPLTRYVRDRALRTWDIVALLERVVSGVSRIHQSGVIHRDLKPSNVLVDTSGQPRVLDFGIARLDELHAAAGRTLEGLIVGTPGYTSPEQINDPASVDVRTDVWALGVIAYELLAGAHPFADESPSALLSLRRVLEDDPAPLRRLAPHVPKDLEAVVMKAMARRKTERYASVAAFADDLENARTLRPVIAHRATLWYRSRRFARRNAVPLGVACAVCVGALAATTLQAQSRREVTRQRDRAASAFSLLQGMVTSADPSFGNRDALMRDVLLGLERKLDEAAATEPLTEAEVRSLLGRMAFSLGEYERSHTLLERAIELRERHGQSNSVGALLDRAALAQTLRWLYRPDEAFELAQRTLAITRERYGGDHQTSLAARDALAGCLHDVGRLSEAEDEYRWLGRTLARVRGERDRDALIARGNLASVLSDAGRYAEAEAELRGLETSWSLNPCSLDAVTNRSNLSLAIANQGRLNEALELLDRVIAEADAALGPTHPTAITALTNRIEVGRRAGEPNDGLSLSAMLVERCRDAFGWAHDLTVNALTGHAASLIRAGRASEAIDLTSTALDAVAITRPDDAAMHARVSASLAAALSTAGRADEAIALYKDSIARLETALGPTHRQPLAAKNNLGVALIDAGRPAEASRVLRAALDSIRQSGYDEMEPVVLRNLGRALLEQGRHDEGRRALEDAFALSQSRQERSNMTVCAGLLAEHYASSGDAESAVKWRKHLNE